MRRISTFTALLPKPESRIRAREGRERSAQPTTGDCRPWPATGGSNARRNAKAGQDPVRPVERQATVRQRSRPLSPKPASATTATKTSTRVSLRCSRMIASLSTGSVQRRRRSSTGSRAKGSRDFSRRACGPRKVDGVVPLNETDARQVARAPGRRVALVPRRPGRSRREIRAGSDGDRVDLVPAPFRFHLFAPAHGSAT